MCDGVFLFCNKLRIFGRHRQTVQKLKQKKTGDLPTTYHWVHQV